MARKTSKKSHSAASPHRSFKRTYREDYLRELNVPGFMEHVFTSFKMIFKNWKIFLPLLVIMSLASVLLIGVPDELSLIVWVFGSLIFLTIWLITIYALRHLMAGQEVSLRDSLYNSMGPLISTLVVLIVAAVQSVPIIILIIAYASAVETNFLSEPFYAFLFLGFAALMILLSGYLLSSTLMALVAATAPGLYPTESLKNASDLMAGRRMRFIMRLLMLAVVIVIIWTVLIGPLIGLNANTTFINVCMIILACFSAIYIATYLYLYYRWMLGYDKKEEKHE